MNEELSQREKFKAGLAMMVAEKIDQAVREKSADVKCCNSVRCKKHKSVKV